MSPREAFKLGFLQKCAADGLTPDETLERIRHAKFMAGDPEMRKEALLGVNNTTAALALATPPVLGVLGGGLLANATSADYDTDEAKKREELAEYQHALKTIKELHARQGLGVH